MLGLGLLLILGCATTANYEKTVRSWEGQDVKSLVRFWGEPDAIEKLSNGKRMYVYARLKHRPVAYEGAKRLLASSSESDSLYSGPIYVKCATYFEVNKKNKITSTLYRGSECKWKD